MKHRFHYKTPIGTICIEDEDGKIAGLYIDECVDEGDNETELIRNAYQQLAEYFNNERRCFDFPLKYDGTEFQKKVWNALQTIPYGETRSYGEIAEQIGSPNASRAVGGANNKNSILIIIPCHRVIGADGALVGFGAGLEAKRFLLELEKKTVY